MKIADLLEMEMRPAITHAGDSFRGDGIELPQPECAPSVFINTMNVEDSPHYAGVCLGCGWASEIVHNENHASRLANDHAFPGWELLPDYESPAWTHNQKTLEKREARAVEKLLETGAYPEDWLASDFCPVVETRVPTPPSTTVGTRHVPGGSPLSKYGYKMCRNDD